jgi:UDP-N-acetylmuramoylalanine--D-glutamate ligase
MENYAAIKERLVSKAHIAVVGIDDPWCAAIAGRLASSKPVITISTEQAASVSVVGHEIVSLGSRPIPLEGVPTLRGKHNAQNAAAAKAALTQLGVDKSAAMADAFRTFPGLPHRMEEIGSIGEALFINDSKATNADSTEKALKSFDDIFWILGGKAKEGGIEPLKEYFPKIRKAYLIGAAADEFARTLGSDVPHVHCGTLDKAVKQAASDAQALGAHAIVLLSPACASYDQFPNYEVRGNHFRDLVRALPGIEAKGA